MNSTKIRTEARRRGITSLYHFTPFPNLEGIFVNRLISKRILDQHQAAYLYTDDWRNDGQSDAVSYSIHDINRSMFSKKLRTSSCTWAILEVDASILWTHSCQFCWVNASSAEIVNHSGFIGGPWAFKEMFADRALSAFDKRSFREVYNVPDNTPTMNDAEVQILEPVGPELIRYVTLARESHRAAGESAMKAAGRVLPIAVAPEVFT